MELKKITVIHNGYIQAVQMFDKVKLETEDKLGFLTAGHLMGTEFVGAVTDVEVFGKQIAEETLLKWTLCQNKVSIMTKQISFLIEYA